MTNPLFTHGHALLVGVGDDLPVTVADATALHDLLVDPGRAAYPPEQVTLLTETSANRQQILAEFDNFIEQVNRDPTATAIVYFSGHGVRVPGGRKYFLVPHGYNRYRKQETAISGKEFTEKIQGIRAKKLLVLLDCCHAGGITTSKEPGEIFVKSPVPPELLDVLGTGSGRVVIASSRGNELSQVGNPHSIFTACLLEALQGKAANMENRGGYVRILDTLRHLFDEVPKRSSDTQHPFVNEILGLNDDFPLCYYAGGSTFLPQEVPPFSSSSEPSNSSSRGRQRLEQRRDGLQSEWDLRSEKINQMRLVLVSEENAVEKFQLEQQLLHEEAALDRLGEKLDAIEQQLGE